VDDASTDGSWELMKTLNARAALRIQLRRLRFGPYEGGSRIIVTLDSDMQNPPSEIPRFSKLESATAGGSRGGRAKGDSWLRRASSKIANDVRNKLVARPSAMPPRLGFRRECIANIKFFKERTDFADVDQNGRLHRH
jgi:hypothetical protein